MDDDKLQVNEHYFTQVRFNFHFQGHVGDENRYVVPFNKVQFLESKRKQNYKMETKWEQNGHISIKDRSKYKDKIGKKVFVLENGICGTVKYLGHLIAGGKLFCGIETVIVILVLFTLYCRNHMKIVSPQSFENREIFSKFKGVGFTINNS